VGLAGVVLAGGASRRMGRDKATLIHPGTGTTMVQRTVAVLASRCDPVFVVAAPGQSLPDMRPAAVLRDEVPGEGPLPATAIGLRAAATAGCEWAFVCAVDMPALAAAVIDELAGYCDADVVLPWDGRDHYLAAIYRTALADRIDALVASGERRMRVLVDAVRAQRVVLSDAGMLANVNTPHPVPDEEQPHAGSCDQP
jgi:molybdopterin-guanine dinucleotide biosynthesis protein A